MKTCGMNVFHDSGMSIPAAATLALLAGLACGALNGFLIAYVGLPSLAVTIGTLALFRGIAVGLLGTTAITEFTDRWADRAPLGWDAMEPAPVGDAVTFLLSDLSRGISGEMIHVDGGFHAMGI